MTSINNSQDVSQLTGSIDKLTSSNKSVESMKDELETLFCENMTMNEGEEGKAKIQKQINAIQDKIDAIQDKIDEINEKIEEVDGQIKDNADKIGDAYAKGYENYNNAIAKEREDQKNEFLIACKNAARVAARNAITEYKPDSGQSFEQYYREEFTKELHFNDKNTVIGLAEYLQDAANMSSATNGLMDDLKGYVGQIQGLKAELQIDLASKSLLERTKNNMADSLIEDAYKNVDTDANIPIYSGKKAEVANSIIQQYSGGKTEGKASTEANVKVDTAKQEQVKNELLANKGDAKYESGDRYSAQQNPELMNLREQFEGGMLEKLQATGMNTEEILTFISSNWNVGIAKDPQTGNWKIPNGHSSDAFCKEKSFMALSNLITSQSQAKTAEGIDQDQMLKLKSAVEKDGVLTKMYEAGFTFKEAMYTLTKAFPDAGVDYKLDTQSQGRSYEIVSDSAESGTLYKTISDTVINYWNVGSSTATVGDKSTSGVVEKIDPFTFQDGDTTYTFLNADKLDDGTFDYTDGKNNDLLGSQKGYEELAALDTNRDGKINGSELDSVMLMANKQKESVGENGKADVDGYKDGSNYKGRGAYTNAVDFDISYTSAKDLGISEIDLAGMQKGSGSGEALGNTTKKYDGFQEEYEDINGSSVINQFTVKMDGKNIVGKETLNTESNLETFYGQVADNKGAGTIGSKISKNDFDDAFDDAQADGAEMLDELDNLQDKLEGVLSNTPKDDWSDYKDEYVEISSKDFYAMDKIIKNGAKAAQRHLTDESEAADAAAEATKETIEQMSGNDVDEIIEDKKEEEREKLDSEE